MPYPSTMGVWPQFRSALPWDAAAITTYLSVSIVFWYMGLIPDLAAMRDRAPGLWRRRVYGAFALGWRGGARQWSRYRVVYGLLAGLATPLVVSVHSIVSTDFAESLLPGWHSTIFPVYFVVGAVFSGFAMVLVLLIPARRVYRLHDVITARHLDALAKLLLAGSLFMSYSYVVEAFTAWYGGDPYERYTLLASRPGGSYAWLYWTMIACNCVAPLALWSRRLRGSPAALMAVSLLVVVGMWVERFVLIVTSQWRDFLPSSWALYTPTWVDGAMLAGTVSCFAFLFLLFLRWVPIVPLSELKTLRRELSRDREEAGDAPRDAR
ncbi:MAG: NrfD/PsrC family molybdoenzyme membrane anchor subunit [Polyangiales bacterium]